MRNLLPESSDTPITKQIDSALELVTGVSTGLRATLGASSPKDESLAIHDPKAPRGSVPLSTQPQRSAYSQLIVFVVGGSNYAEYASVLEHVKKKQMRLQVTFGTTDLVSGGEFVEQLSMLHKH